MNPSLIRVVHLGIKSLMLHKMRSALTMLGIIFGVCSVIAMLAIGEGASFEAQEAIRKLGSRNIIIRSVQPPQGQSTSESKRTYTATYGLKLADVAHLTNTVPSITQTLAKRRYRVKARHGRMEVPCTVWGTQPHHRDMSQLDIVQGQFFTAEHAQARRSVCVITESLARALFPAENPIGGLVNVNNKDVFEVTGIVRETGTAASRSPGGDEPGEALDANIYVPLTTAHSRLGILFTERNSGGYTRERVELHELVAEIDATENVAATKASIAAALKRSHPKRDYEIIVPLELLRQAEQTKRIFNIVLGSIAGISLIVGGIGIMNIMLATVTERTREIGVRRALGASRTNIIVQFLMETLSLCLVGGLIGVAAGWLFAYAREFVTGDSTIVTIPSIIMAFGLSVFIGVKFGLYPALRAAYLDPIEALRHN